MERIVLLMDCFGNFNLAQIAANAAAQKMAIQCVEDAASFLCSVSNWRAGGSSSSLAE
jgi:hypothetical protein